MKLSFKKFAIELLVNLLIFSGLSILFVLIYVGREWPEILVEVYKIIPLLSLWLSFTILLFHLVFLNLFSRTRYKNAVINFLILFVAIYISDISSLNITAYPRVHLGSLTFYSTDFWMRFAMFFAYGLAYSFIRGFSYMKEQRAFLQKENTESQLKQLQSQIEPHLIFNTLNSIYALAMEEKAERTSLCIEELSALFLYSFRQSESNISIGKELDFLEKYIHLNEIRFGNNQSLQLNTKIEWDKQAAFIAPMLLINFIENAFKYGVDRNGNSMVNICISVKDKNLNMIVENTIHKGEKVIQNGIGLTNTKKRLELIYAGNYYLNETADAEHHHVDLEIKL